MQAPVAPCAAEHREAPRAPLGAGPQSGRPLVATGDDVHHLVAGAAAEARTARAADDLDALHQREREVAQHAPWAHRLEGVGALAVDHQQPAARRAGVAAEHRAVLQPRGGHAGGVGPGHEVQHFVQVADAHALEVAALEHRHAGGGLAQRRGRPAGAAHLRAEELLQAQVEQGGIVEAGRGRGSRRVDKRHDEGGDETHPRGGDFLGRRSYPPACSMRFALPLRSTSGGFAGASRWRSTSRPRPREARHGGFPPRPYHPSPGSGTPVPRHAAG